MLVQFQMTPDLSLVHIHEKRRRRRRRNEMEGLAPCPATTTDKKRCRDLCIHRMELIPLDMRCK